MRWRWSSARSNARDEVTRQAGEPVVICERHYAGIFEDYEPAKRTSGERDPGRP